MKNQSQYRPYTGSSQIESNRQKNQMAHTFYEGQHYIYKDPFANTYDRHEKDEFVQNIPLWRQSGATWRHSTASHKFPISQRFPEPLSPGYGDSKIDFPSQLSKRSTSIGYGPKTDIFRPKFIEKGRTQPGPFNYNIKREFQVLENKDISLIQQKDKCYNGNQQLAIYMMKGNNRGRSFENYKEKDKLPTNPQVGKYNVAEKIGGEKVKWSMFPRGRVFNDNPDKYLPAPNHYKLNEQLVKVQKHKGTSFGYGQKINIAKPLNSNPGAGSYTPKTSSFTKQDKRYKLNNSFF